MDTPAAVLDATYIVAATAGANSASAICITIPPFLITSFLFFDDVFQDTIYRHTAKKRRRAILLDDGMPSVHTFMILT
jgi:hypothetical protein